MGGEGSLARRGPVPEGVGASDAGEEAWIDVIRKMDEVYSELVDSQTQLEHQNARLEEAQRFIGSVLASMTDVLIVCDAAGCIQQVNPALEQLAGRKEAQLVGRALGELFEPESRGRLSTKAGSRAAMEGFSDCEVLLIGQDGAPAPLSMNCSPRLDARGRLAGFVLIGRPLGELRRAYKELDEAHRKLTQTQAQLVVSEKMAALGRLVAGVAHELNNPISFIFGNMHVLRRYSSALIRFLTSQPAAADEDARELREELKIDRIVKDMTPLIDGSLEGAERVSDIVKDLLRFSSTQEEQPEPFDLVRLVRTAADWAIKGERVKPRVRVTAPETFEIESRKGYLHQIVVNLVQNAVDVLAERDRPLIEIDCRAEGGQAVVTVADNGTGILDERMDKIFEPFFTTKPIGQGTGLGLYVSYSMAQKLGGTLTAANRPEGGAVFTLRIPVNR